MVSTGAILSSIHAEHRRTTRSRTNTPLSAILARVRQRDNNPYHSSSSLSFKASNTRALSLSLSLSHTHTHTTTTTTTTNAHMHCADP
jgi:hypothetical protein